jgi:hypothetical protein
MYRKADAYKPRRWGVWFQLVIEIAVFLFAVRVLPVRVVGGDLVGAATLGFLLAATMFGIRRGLRDLDRLDDLRDKLDVEGARESAPRRSEGR